MKTGASVNIENLGDRLFLFRFFHEIDNKWILDNGQWTFNKHLLVMHQLKAAND
ncbi:hypothetical protein LINGRAHAP2_LOCUS10028 [Linum grandiflorum]